MPISTRRIEFRGRLTEEDWRQAMALDRRVRQVSDPRLVGGFAGVVGLGLTLLALTVPALWLLVPGSLLLLFGWFQLSQDRRTWRQNQPREEESGFLSEEGWEAASATSAAQFKWAAVGRYFFGPAILLLEIQPQGYVILPRHFFASDSDWQDLRELLSTAVPTAPPASSLFTQLPTGQRRWVWWVKQLGILFFFLALVILYTLSRQ